MSCEASLLACILGELLREPPTDSTSRATKICARSRSRWAPRPTGCGTWRGRRERRGC